MSNATLSSLVLNQSQGFNVSPKYVPIKTGELVTQLESSGYKVRSIQTTKTRNQDRQPFTKHLVRLQHDSMLNLLSESKSDSLGSIRPEIVLRNSFDGSSSFEIMLGLYRLVCANGLVVGSTFDSIKVRHVGDAMPKVIDSMERIKSNAERLVATAETWNSIDMTDTKSIEFAEHAANLIKPVNAVSVDASSLLELRRSMDSSPTLWNVFNRVQENALNGNLRYITKDIETEELNPRKMRRVRSIDRNVEINRELWNLAESFAA